MNAQVRSLRPLPRIALTATLALAPTFSLGAAAAHAQTAETASVRIIKDAQPNGPHNFHFTTDLRTSNEEGLDNFTLDDDPTSARPNFEQFEGVAPGTYWVVEHRDDGWTLSAIDCSGGQVTKDLPAGKVTITVAAGDAITCTYVNVRNAHGETTTPPATIPEQPAATTTQTQPIQEGAQSDPTVSGEVLAAAPAAAAPGAAPAPVALPATLPRTGSSIELLAGFGTAMVAAGAALLTRSRRRTAGNGARP
jgi:LPXTG-motif cell wall-anchored protein